MLDENNDIFPITQCSDYINNGKFSELNKQTNDLSIFSKNIISENPLNADFDVIANSVKILSPPVEGVESVQEEKIDFDEAALEMIFSQLKQYDLLLKELGEEIYESQLRDFIETIELTQGQALKFGGEHGKTFNVGFIGSMFSESALALAVDLSVKSRDKLKINRSIDKIKINIENIKNKLAELKIKDEQSSEVEIFQNHLKELLRSLDSLSDQEDALTTEILLNTTENLLASVKGGIEFGASLTQSGIAVLHAVGAAVGGVAAVIGVLHTYKDLAENGENAGRIQREIVSLSDRLNSLDQSEPEHSILQLRLENLYFQRNEQRVKLAQNMSVLTGSLLGTASVAKLGMAAAGLSLTAAASTAITATGAGAAILFLLGIGIGVGYGIYKNQHVIRNKIDNLSFDINASKELKQRKALKEEMLLKCLIFKLSRGVEADLLDIDAMISKLIELEVSVEYFNSYLNPQEKSFLENQVNKLLVDFYNSYGISVDFFDKNNVKSSHEGEKFAAEIEWANRLKEMLTDYREELEFEFNSSGALEEDVLALDEATVGKLIKNEWQELNRLINTNVETKVNRDKYLEFVGNCNRLIKLKLEGQIDVNDLSTKISVFLNDENVDKKLSVKLMRKINYIRKLERQINEPEAPQLKGRSVRVMSEISASETKLVDLENYLRPLIQDIAQKNREFALKEYSINFLSEDDKEGGSLAEFRERFIAFSDDEMKTCFKYLEDWNSRISQPQLLTQTLDEYIRDGDREKAWKTVMNVMTGVLTSDKMTA